MRMAMSAAMAVATLTVLSKASARRATDPVSHHASVLMPRTRAPTKMLAMASRMVLDIVMPRAWWVVRLSPTLRKSKPFHAQRPFGSRLALCGRPLGPDGSILSEADQFGEDVGTMDKPQNLSRIADRENPVGMRQEHPGDVDQVMLRLHAYDRAAHVIAHGARPLAIVACVQSRAKAVVLDEAAGKPIVLSKHGRRRRARLDQQGGGAADRRVRRQHRASLRMTD